MYPDGQAVAYAPNALGQPTRAGAYATGVEHHPDGATKTFTYGNGMVHVMVQNVRGLPTWWSDCTVAVNCDLYERVVHLRYDYDANGNVSGMTDNSLSGRQTRAMTYDGLDRLLTATSPMYPGGATYAYNVLDNLTRVSVAGRDHRYLYDGNNRLVSATQGPGGPVAMTLAYDARGNLSSRNGQAFGFDLGNRLRTALGTESYRYDAYGRRARTSNSSGALYEMYAQDGTLMWQHDTGAGFRFRHVHLNGRAVALHRLPIGSGGGEVVFTWLTDPQGSQLAAADGPAVLQTSEYEPYGKLLNRANNNRIGYTGHVMDAGAGLIQMQQRYYDPGIGAMLSVDPVTAYEQPVTNFCRYCYARNNPYKYIDPDGREGIAIRHMERDIEAMNRGEMSQQEFMDRSEARAAGAVAGLAIVGTTLAAPTVMTTAMANPGAIATATEIAAGAAGVTGTAGAWSALRPGGQLIGQAGNSPNIRIMQGGLKEANSLFKQLTRGGEVVSESTYKGTLVKVGEDALIGLRTTSTRGSHPPTIDVMGGAWKGLGAREIKFIEDNRK